MPSNSPNSHNQWLMHVVTLSLSDGLSVSPSLSKKRISSGRRFLNHSVFPKLPLPVNVNTPCAAIGFSVSATATADNIQRKIKTSFRLRPSGSIFFVLSETVAKNSLRRGFLSHNTLSIHVCTGLNTLPSAIANT